MDSLMFTFSVDQMSIQLDLQQKHRESKHRLIRKRLNTSSPLGVQKKEISSFNNNQLFENCPKASFSVDQTSQKNLSTINVKKTSLKLQEKKKLRNIIDHVLGKNFQTSHNSKIDSIPMGNRKNKHKLHNRVIGLQKSQSSNQNEEWKENQFNMPNVDLCKNKNPLNSNEDAKKISHLKIKRHQFANLKIRNIHQFSQRYDNQSKNENQQKFQRKCVNISRQSTGKQSLNKKDLRSRTPKIMYPESDSKLPSVFRNHKIRGTAEGSIKKRTRIFSAHFIADTDDKNNQTCEISRKKNTLQMSGSCGRSIRIGRRPQSTMLESKRWSNQFKNGEIIQEFGPRKLMFEASQKLSENINKKLNSKEVAQSNNSASIRVSTRAKSSYVYRKLKQISTLINQPIDCPLPDGKTIGNNLSYHSRETAEQSSLQQSTDRTFGSNGVEDSLNFVCRTIEDKKGLGITFQLVKE